MIKKNTVSQYTQLLIDTQHDQQSIICKMAEDFWSRAQGLLFAPPLKQMHMDEIMGENNYQGIFLKHCRAVHTMGMRYGIDIIYLAVSDEAGDLANTQFQICRCVQHLKPWRASLCSHAQHTLELAAGEIVRRAIAVGDYVNVVVGPTAHQSV